MKNIQELVKSSILASISNEVTNGNLETFLKVKKEHQLEVIKSISSKNTRKMLASKIGAEMTEELLNSSVTFEDKLNLQSMVKKAFYEHDFQKFDQVIQDQVKKELPKLRASISSEIQDAGEKLEYFKEQNPRLKKLTPNNIQKLFVSGRWMSPENMEMDQAKERADQRFEDYYKNKTLLDLFPTKFEDGDLGADKTLREAELQGLLEVEALDELKESLTTKVRAEEGLLEEHKEDFWSPEDEKELNLKAEESLSWDDAIAEKSLEIDALNQEFENLLSDVFNAQAEADLDFDQLHFFGLDEESYLVNGNKLNKIIREREARESGDSDSENKKVNLKEEGKIEASINKVAVSDEDLNVFDPRYQKLTDSLLKLVDFQKKKKDLQDDLSKLKYEQQKLMREVDKLWLRRKLAKGKFYNYFEKKYGDNTPVKLAFKITEGKDRLKFIKTFSRSDLWNKVRSRDIVSTIFGRSANNLTSEQDFMLSQIFEKLFYDLPVGTSSELVLKHPNWDGLEFKVKPSRAEKFNKVLEKGDNEKTLKFINDNKDFKAALEEVLKHLLKNKKLNELFPDKYPKVDKTYYELANTLDKKQLSRIRNTLASRIFKDISSAEIVPRRAGDSQISEELYDSDLIERKEDSSGLIVDSVGSGSIFLDSPLWNDLGVEVLLDDESARKLRLAQQDMSLEANKKTAEVNEERIPFYIDRVSKDWKNISNIPADYLERLEQEEQVLNSLKEALASDWRNIETLPQNFRDLLNQDESAYKNAVIRDWQNLTRLSSEQQQNLLNDEDVLKSLQSAVIDNFLNVTLLPKDYRDLFLQDEDLVKKVVLKDWSNLRYVLDEFKSKFSEDPQVLDVVSQALVEQFDNISKVPTEFKNHFLEDEDFLRSAAQSNLKNLDSRFFPKDLREELESDPGFLKDSILSNIGNIDKLPEDLQADFISDFEVMQFLRNSVVNNWNNLDLLPSAFAEKLMSDESLVKDAILSNIDNFSLMSDADKSRVVSDPQVLGYIRSLLVANPSFLKDLPESFQSEFIEDEANFISELETEVFRDPSKLRGLSDTILNKLLSDNETLNAAIDFAKEDIEQNLRVLPNRALELMLQDGDFKFFLKKLVQDDPKNILKLPELYKQELKKDEEVQSLIKDYDLSQKERVEQAKEEAKRRDLEGDKFANFLLSDPYFKTILESLEERILLNTPISRFLPQLVKSDLKMTYDDLEALSDEERESQNLPSPDKVYQAFNSKLIDAFREANTRLKESLYDYERMDEDYESTRYPDDPKNTVIKRREIDAEKLKEELGLEPADILLATKGHNKDDEDRKRYLSKLLKALTDAGLVREGEKVNLLSILLENGYISKTKSGEIKPINPFVEDAALPQNNIITKFFEKLGDLSYSTPNVSLKNFLDRSAANWVKEMNRREKGYSDKERDMSSLVGDNDSDGDIDVLDHLKKFMDNADFDSLIKDEYAHLDEPERKSHILNMLDSFAEKHHISHSLFEDLKSDIRTVLMQPETQSKILDLVEALPTYENLRENQSITQSTRFQDILLEGFDSLKSSSAKKNKLLFQNFINSLKDSEVLDVSDFDIKEELKNWANYLSDPDSHGSAGESYSFDSLVDKLFTPEVEKNLDKEVNSLLNKDMDQIANEMAKKLPKIPMRNLKIRKDFYDKVGKGNIIEELRKNKLPMVIGPSLFKKFTREYLVNGNKFARLTPGAFLFEYFVLPYLKNVVLGRNPIKVIENDLEKYFNNSEYKTEILKSQWLQQENKEVAKRFKEAGGSKTRNQIRREVRKEMKSNQSSILKGLRSKVDSYIQKQLPHLINEKSFKKHFSQVLNKTRFMEAITPLFFMNNKFMTFDEDGDVINPKAEGDKKIYNEEGEITPLTPDNVKYVARTLRNEWLTYSKRYFLPKLRTLLKSLGHDLHLADELPFHTLFEYQEKQEKAKPRVKTPEDSLQKSLTKNTQGEDPKFLTKEDIFNSLGKDELKLLPKVLKKMEEDGKLNPVLKSAFEIDDVQEMANRQTQDRKKLVNKLLSLKESKMVDQYFNLLDQNEDKAWLPKMLEQEEDKKKRLESKLKSSSEKEFGKRVNDVKSYMERIRLAVPKEEGVSIDETLEKAKVKALEGQDNLSEEEQYIVNAFDSANSSIRSQPWYRNRNDFEEALQAYKNDIGRKIADSMILEINEIDQKRKSGEVPKNVKNFKSPVSKTKQAEARKLYNYYKDEPWFPGVLQKARANKLESFLVDQKLDLADQFSKDKAKRAKKSIKDLEKRYNALDWFVNTSDLVDSDLEDRVNLLQNSLDTGDYRVITEHKNEPWFSKVMDIVQARRGKDLSVPLFSKKQVKPVKTANLDKNKDKLSVLVNKTALSKLL